MSQTNAETNWRLSRLTSVHVTTGAAPGPHHQGTIIATSHLRIDLLFYIHITVHSCFHFSIITTAAPHRRKAEVRYNRYNRYPDQTTISFFAHGVPAMFLWQKCFNGAHKSRSVLRMSSDSRKEPRSSDVYCRARSGLVTPSQRQHSVRGPSPGPAWHWPRRYTSLRTPQLSS